MADVPLMNNPMTTAGDVLYGGASGAPTRLAVGTAGQVLTVNAGATAPEWAAAASGGTGLLAVKAHRAGSDAALASTTNTTSTDVDATNAAVTFTAPASGNVLIRFTGMVSITGSSQAGYWTVRESTTVLATSLVDQTSTALAASRTVAFYLTGVTAGSHTYKWGHHTTAGDTISLFTGPTFGQLVMEVWSAP